MNAVIEISIIIEVYCMFYMFYCMFLMLYLFAFMYRKML